MLREFREFLMRGNIVDLAVAFIAGVAFSAVVTSLVSDVIMQLVAAVAGKPDFSALTLTLNDSVIGYGAFLTALINFVLTMAAVFFLVVKPVNSLTTRFVAPAQGEPSSRECPECLSSIPSKARRCSHCTAQVAPVA
jgi:large conductance mechanosensitive channel